MVYRQFDITSRDYIIVKSRTHLSDDLEESHFGKIYGEIKYGISDDNKGGVVMFQYFFNPTPNDRNLEFDGKNNLFGPAWRDLSWPR